MKVFLISSSRADFGILKNLCSVLKKDKSINFKIIVTGSHLSKKHGFTFKEIIENNFKIFKKIKVSNITKSQNNVLNDTGDLLKKISALFKKEKPNLIIVLGDRLEILAISLAAYIYRIPIAHIHGGELTTGSLDDGFRHCISKLSTIHFPSNNIYKKRLIQLGESPKTVFNVGALGVENIFKTKFLSKNEIQKQLKIKLKKNIISICLQPEITEKLTKDLAKQTLDALKKYNDKTLIFTMPGADLNNEILFERIKKFVSNKKNSYFFKNLGSQKYLSLLKMSDICLGNSSSGIIEMPIFKKPTINIGNRQDGREKSDSIIDVKPNKVLIQKKIDQIYSGKFKRKFNIFRKQETAKKIQSLIKNFDLKKYNYKKFYNISF